MKQQTEKRIALISTHGYVSSNPPLGAPDTGGQVVFVLELAMKLGLFGYKVDISCPVSLSVHVGRGG